MNDYQVFLINLPVNEMVTKNPDDSYTIFINARLDFESQQKAYYHAMKHIAHGDFHKTNIQSIESIAHSQG